MEHLQVHSIADEVAQVLHKDNPAFYLQLVQLLVAGRPVAPAQLAATLNLSDEQVAQELSSCPGLEYDQNGNVVGAGVTLIPTQHQLQVNGQDLYTWCALDTLSYPVLLNQSARVTSRCPVSGEIIQLTVTPEHIEDVQPESTAVSLVIPEAAACKCDVRGTFCNYGYFFRSRETAAVWQAEHPEAIILSVEEAYRIGQKLAQRCQV